MSKEIDCRGLACPRPVLETKKALDGIGAGTVTVIVDNPTARENVTMFAENAGCRVEVAEKEGDYILTITREGSGTGGQTPGTPPDAAEKTSCPQTAGGGTRPLTYLFSSNLFGQGAPDLGLTLIKSLFSTLVEMDPPPDTLIFLNSGVFLVCETSPVLKQLRVLGGRGTEIIACGTCLNYYKLQDKLQVGRASNMLEINERLTGPGKVVYIT